MTADAHLQAVITDCLTRRQSREEMELRLFVAAGCAVPAIEGRES